MSMSALEAGMVMMICCHHLSLTMMHCRLIGIPPLEPSLADEVALQNSEIDINYSCQFSTDYLFGIISLRLTWEQIENHL